MSLETYTYNEIVAPAKLNLRLKILGRRADGYHQLSMINTAISLGDRLVIKLLSDSLYEVTEVSFGRGFNPALTKQLSAELCDPEKNILLKAAKFFFEKFGIRAGISVKLHKEIPAGAGLGGGSSDAAAVLRFLHKTLTPETSERGLTELALSLGADVPYFLNPVPAVVTGVGEVLTPLPIKLKQQLQGYPIVLIVPNFQLSTIAVYKKYRELHPNVTRQPDPLTQNTQLQELTINDLPLLVENDLEQASTVLEPRMGVLLAELRARLSGYRVGMSGSGSAIFALPLDRNSLKPLSQISKLANDCETFDLFMTVD